MYPLKELAKRIGGYLFNNYHYRVISQKEEINQRHFRKIVNLSKIFAYDLGDFWRFVIQTHESRKNENYRF